MKTDRGILFDGLLIRYTKTVERSIKSRTKKGRDKEDAKAQIESELDFYINLLQADKNQVKISDIFSA